LAINFLKSYSKLTPFLTPFIWQQGFSKKRAFLAIFLINLRFGPLLAFFPGKLGKPYFQG